MTRNKDIQTKAALSFNQLSPILLGIAFSWKFPFYFKDFGSGPIVVEQLLLFFVSIVRRTRRRKEKFFIGI